MKALPKNTKTNRLRFFRDGWRRLAKEASTALLDSERRVRDLEEELDSALKSNAQLYTEVDALADAVVCLTERLDAVLGPERWDDDLVIYAVRRLRDDLQIQMLETNKVINDLVVFEKGT